MSDDRPTIPAPAADDLPALLQSLRASLERTSELCVKVAGKLSKVELAQYTAEHRLNVQRDEIDGLKLQLAEVRVELAELAATGTRPPTAAE